MGELSNEDLIAIRAEVDRAIASASAVQAGAKPWWYKLSLWSVVGFLAYTVIAGSIEVLRSGKQITPELGAMLAAGVPIALSGLVAVSTSQENLVRTIVKWSLLLIVAVVVAVALGCVLLAAAGHDVSIDLGPIEVSPASGGSGSPSD